jgi:hypothetical protein
VHRLAHDVVAAERELRLEIPPLVLRARAALLDQRQRLEERLGEAAMLLDARSRRRVMVSWLEDLCLAGGD